MILKGFDVAASSGRVFKLQELNGYQQMHADMMLPEDARADAGIYFRVAMAMVSVDRPMAPLRAFDIVTSSGRNFSMLELDGLRQVRADMLVPEGRRADAGVYFRAFMAIKSIDGKELPEIRNVTQLQTHLHDLSGRELDEILRGYFDRIDASVKHDAKPPKDAAQEFAPASTGKDMEHRLKLVTGKELDDLLRGYYADTIPTKEELPKESTPGAA
jgi:hypothetical protein